MRTSLIVFLLLFLNVRAQKITGYVFDFKTKEPIVGASVYYNASSIGTVTDENGMFEIGRLFASNATLIVRHLGYETKKLVSPSNKFKLEIGMKEEVENLNEIVVTSDPFSRKEKMEVFKLEFLGDTRGGRNCTILNEEDIELFFNSYSNTLTAYSKRPIRIRNDFLGYIILFDIDEFRIFFKQKSLQRVGNIYHTLFEGSTQFFDVSENNSKILNRRREVYLGSTMHFIRSCWYGDIKNQNFMLKKNYKEIDFDQFLKSNGKDSTTGFGKFHFLDSLYVIYYRNKSNYRSTIKISNKDTLFLLDKYGNYSPYKEIIFGGYMSNYRIGEMLPMNYGL